MSATFSVKCPSVDQKKEFQEKIGKIVEIDPLAENQSQALGLLFDSYFEVPSPVSSPDFLLTVQDVIDSINCTWLKFEAPDFKCFELFHKRKKPESLGEDPDKIPERCQSCLEGKAQEIRKQYLKKLRGYNINGLLQIINLFQKFAEDGVPSTIYFCNRIPDRQIMTGLKIINCPKFGSKVPIDPTCKDPLCPHFEEYTIRVDQDFPGQTLKLIEGIAEDVKRIQDLSPKKQVDAEQVDKDV